MGSRFENRLGAFWAKFEQLQEAQVAGPVLDQPCRVSDSSILWGTVKLRYPDGSTLKVSGSEFGQANYPDQFPPSVDLQTSPEQSQPSKVHAIFERLSRN